MILKAALWPALVWLCMSQGPQIHLGSAALPSCEANATCADPIAAANVAWRDAVVTRLVVIKKELRDVKRSKANESLVGDEQAREAVPVLTTGRFAAYALPRTVRP